MKSYNATDARKIWFELIEQAGKPGSIISIKHRNLPDVILMSFDEFEGWQETLEIMSDPKLMKDIRDSLEDKEIVGLEELEEEYSRKKKK